MMNLKPFKSNAVSLEREKLTMGLSNYEVRIIGIILLMVIFGIVIWKIVDRLKNPVEIIE